MCHPGEALHEGEEKALDEFFRKVGPLSAANLNTWLQGVAPEFAVGASELARFHLPPTPHYSLLRESEAVVPPLPPASWTQVRATELAYHNTLVNIFTLHHQRAPTQTELKAMMIVGDRI